MLAFLGARSGLFVFALLGWLLPVCGLAAGLFIEVAFLSGGPSGVYSEYPGLFFPIFLGIAYVSALLGIATTCLVYRPPRQRGEDADGPCCRRCGYSLRGLPSRRCPECGTRF